MPGDPQTTADGPLIGYMCKIDFDHERFEPIDGNRVYASEASLRRAHTCADECGIVEVEIRLRRIVKEGTDD